MQLVEIFEKYDFELDDEIRELLRTIDLLDQTKTFEEWIVKNAEMLGASEDEIKERIEKGFDDEVGEKIRSLHSDLIKWRNKK